MLIAFCGFLEINKPSTEEVLSLSYFKQTSVPKDRAFVLNQLSESLEIFTLVHLKIQRIW